jgi:hypothetical protein
MAASVKNKRVAALILKSIEKKLLTKKEKEKLLDKILLALGTSRHSKPKPKSRKRKKDKA